MSDATNDFSTAGTATLEWQSFEINPSFDWNPTAIEALVRYYNTFEYCDGELCVLLGSFAADGKGPSARDIRNHLRQAAVAPRLVRPGTAKLRSPARMNEFRKAELKANYLAGWSLTHLSVASAISTSTVKTNLAKMVESGELTYGDWDLEAGKPSV